MIRDVSNSDISNTHLTTAATLARTDISNDEKFSLVGRIVIEAAKKFDQQDARLNEYRQKLSESEKTIDNLNKNLDGVMAQNIQLAKDACILKSEVVEMKKQNVKRMCEKEVNSLIASKASCIHRQNAAYAGSVLLGITLVGIAAMAPTMMHGMGISDDIMKIKGKMRAIETVPECIMFPEIYQDLSNSYYEYYKWEDSSSYNFSADPEDSASWHAMYSSMNDSSKIFFRTATENLKNSIANAKKKTESYYT